MENDTISSAGSIRYTLVAALLAVLEGCRLSAYKDPVGIPTIGFGHTLGVKIGQTITYEQAVKFMQEDCAALFKEVTNMNDVKAAALVSFGYNCGIGAMRRVIAGTSKLTDFTHAGGIELAGLVKRRNLEQALIDAS